MRITPGGNDPDVEDRRGSSGMGFGGAPIGIGGAILLLVLSLLFHKNFFALLGNGSDTSRPAAATQTVQETPQEHQEAEVVNFVVGDVQKTWESTIPNYRHAHLVLFRDGIDSACGLAQTAAGPFYCPEDEKVYLDLAFFDELRERFHASGDFAEAYVIAHEYGHHVQKILGIEPKVQRLMESDPRHAGQYSVRLELQADCFAGMWAHSTQQRNILEKGDVEEGLNAASSVGDDRIQRMAGKRVNPETFTHGSAEERSSWFRRGYESGAVESCNTFQQ